MIPGHYLIRYWVVVNWTVRNTILWNLKFNIPFKTMPLKISVVCKILANWEILLPLTAFIYFKVPNRRAWISIYFHSLPSWPKLIWPCPFIFWRVGWQPVPISSLTATRCHITMRVWAIHLPLLWVLCSLLRVCCRIIHKLDDENKYLLKTFVFAKGLLVNPRQFATLTLYSDLQNILSCCDANMSSRTCIIKPMQSNTNPVILTLYTALP